MEWVQSALFSVPRRAGLPGPAPEPAPPKLGCGGAPGAHL